MSGLQSHEQELAEIMVSGESILSGIPFRKEVGNGWNSASIDQKVAGKGYNWDNVRVVLDAENKGMNTWGKDITLYVWLSVALREAQKRGDTEFIIGVLQHLAELHKKLSGVEKCPSSSSSAKGAKGKSNSSLSTTKRRKTVPAAVRSKKSNGVRLRKLALVNLGKLED